MRFSRDSNPNTSAKIAVPTRRRELSEHFCVVLVSERVHLHDVSVHDAWVEVCDSDGERVKYNAIAKLAFTEETQELLKNEYTAYRRLSTKGVAHVPDVLGLFEDVQDDVLALLMTCAGEPFKIRQTPLPKAQM